MWKKTTLQHVPGSSQLKNLTVIWKSTECVQPPHEKILLAQLQPFSLPRAFVEGFEPDPLDQQPILKGGEVVNESNIDGCNRHWWSVVYRELYQVGYLNTHSAPKAPKEISLSHELVVSRTIDHDVNQKDI